jgi:hypothetical protein
MATKHHQQVLLKKMKTQLRHLRLREEASRKQLHAALKKMRALGEAYKIKLVSKISLIKSQVDEIQTSSYMKAAEKLERQILNNMKTKVHALAAAVAAIEKHHARTSAKKVTKKSKKPSRR